MQRRRMHVILQIPTALGLIAIGAVLAARFGIDIYAVGFFAFGGLALWRTLRPVLFPDRYKSPRIQRRQLVVDLVGLVLVAASLGLLYFERTDLLSQISV